MSEIKKTYAELQTEFTTLCIKAGQLQYQIDVAERDLKLINDQLRDVALQGVAAEAQEKKNEN
jgi:hypothetical protein